MTCIKIRKSTGIIEVLGNSDSITPADEARLGVQTVLQNIRDSSITPTTFSERIFDIELDHPTYVDSYHCGLSKVIRFCINKSSSKLSALINQPQIDVDTNPLFAF